MILSPVRIDSTRRSSTSMERMGTADASTISSPLRGSDKEQWVYIFPETWNRPAKQKLIMMAYYDFLCTVHELRIGHTIIKIEIGAVNCRKCAQQQNINISNASMTVNKAWYKCKGTSSILL